MKSPTIVHGGVDPRRGSPKKQFDHIVIEHHFTSPEHMPERHTFGKTEGAQAIDHIKKNMDVAAQPESEEEETELENPSE